MKLSEKFDLIIAGKPLPTKTLTDATEANHTTVIPRHRASYYFEENSMVSSPWKLVKRSRPTCFIGRSSYTNAGGFSRARLLIGRYCSIGQRASLAAGQHAMHHLTTGSVPGNLGPAYTAEEKAYLGIRDTPPYTVIENDVWIGDGAIIMPGIRICTGSVVAANAVVTRDVAPYTIVGGVPAKPIRRRFPDDLPERLLASEWWEYSAAFLEAAPTGNIFAFLDHVAASSSAPDFDHPTYRL